MRRTLLTTFRNFSSQLCQPHSRCAPAPSAACTRLPRLLQRRPGGGGSPRPAGAARTQRTYSHNGVSAGTATPRGASCAAPGARLRRAARGSARWPGSPAPRPAGALVSGLSLPSPGRPEMGDPLARCSPLGARCSRRALTPKQNWTPVPRSVPAAAASRAGFLSPAARPRYSPRWERAPRSSDPYRERGAAPWPPKPAPLPARRRKGLSGALGWDPLQLGPALRQPPGGCGRPAWFFTSRGFRGWKWTHAGKSKKNRRRYRQAGRPGGVAQLQKNKQRGSLPSGEIARCPFFSFFFFFLSKVASATLCLQNAGFPFHDKKLRVCACVGRAR